MIFYCWGNLQFWILWWTPSSPNGRSLLQKKLTVLQECDFWALSFFVKEEGVVGLSEELPAGLAQPQFGSTALDETKGANVG